MTEKEFRDSWISEDYDKEKEYEFIRKIRDKARGSLVGLLILFYFFSVGLTFISALVCVSNSNMKYVGVSLCGNVFFFLIGIIPIYYGKIQEKIFKAFFLYVLCAVLLILVYANEKSIYIDIKIGLASLLIPLVLLIFSIRWVVKLYPVVKTTKEIEDAKFKYRNVYYYYFYISRGLNPDDYKGVTENDIEEEQIKETASTPMAKARILFDGHTDNIDDLRKEFKKLVKVYHPDTGGDEELFKAIQQVFEEHSKRLNA